jgi:Uncharacterised nucleotidyltransferase
MVRADAAEARRALADLVIGGPTRARDAVEKIATRAMWADIVTCSGAWRVTPPLRARLAELRAPVDPQAVALLRQLTLAAAAQSTLVIQHTGAVLDRLDEAGVDYVAFKGVALIAGLYRDPAARMISDLDVLVAQSDLEAVDVAASSAGFRRRPVYAGTTFEDCAAELAAEGLVHSPAIDFADDDGVELDVHARIGLRPAPVMSTAALIRRAERHVLAGRTISVAGPLDAQLLTAHHALRANFKPVTTLKDLCDLAAWWKVQPERWRIDDLVGLAHESGLGAALLGAWQVLADHDPESQAGLVGIPAVERALGSADRRHGNQLARLFDHQLTAWQLNRDLLTLLCRPTRSRRLLTNRSERASSVDVPPLWLRLPRVAAESLQPRHLVDHLRAARIQRRYR